jgi:ABC-2 type transport system ATP-binding protein
MAGMIEVRKIRKTFGATIALDDVSFDVHQGEVLGFLGPNAAGKTTAMRILTCYLPQDSGTVRVAGFDTATDSLAVRSRIGYLPENAPLYLDMGVVEYLRFVGRVRGMDSLRLETRIGDMIEACGLRRMAHRTIGTLSKGFRQRVGLAQALIHDPDVLILDEPTSGLDPNQIIEIRELIKRIGREKTVILSTHILPEVESTCSRVLIINEGRLVASGTPGELTAQATGEARTHFTVKGDREQIESVVRQSGIATDVRFVGAESGRARFSIRSDVNDPEERLFQLAVQNGWVLAELRRESVSLEEVFRRLTTQDALAP